MIELVAIGAVFVTTYLLLMILGPRPGNIFVSIEERQRWSGMLASNFGAFVYLSNVVATLTSLATVYVFFIGTTQLFGYYILVSLVSILIAGPVTLRFTRRLAETRLFSARFVDSEAATAAITSLFWSPETRKVSLILQLLAQVAILCILWLEFATLAKLLAGLLGFDTPYWQTIVMFLSVLFVFDFIFRNGLRGFLFADLLHFPLIAIGVVLFLGGTMYVAVSSGGFSLEPFTRPPKLPEAYCIIFVVATLFLNSFLLITSEPHWLRVWTMRDRVQSATMMSLATAMAVWTFLIIAGFLIVTITQRIGLDAVVDAVKELKTYSIVWSIAFWVSVVAAIFSTADTQLYSFLVLSAFDSKTGKLHPAPRFIRVPFLSALVVAVAFSVIFWLIEISRFPFEPIVFFVFPIFLCSVPAFVELLWTDHVRAAPMLVSIGLYLCCGLAMILLPAYSFPLSLAAPLMPALVSLAVLVLPRTKEAPAGVSSLKPEA